jgi:hypothetical protein
MTPSFAIDDLKYGYYTYKDQIYFNRQDAFAVMLATGDYAGQVKFHFNDDVFSSIDWSKKIDVDISDLYRQRAQQLRDSHKYLILAFSGGSDSTQILLTFLKNNIFLDEIQVICSEKAIAKLDRSMMLADNEFQNFLEYERAVVPMLKIVRERSPNTKINIVDVSDFIVDQLSKNKMEYFVSNPKYSLQASDYVINQMPRVESYILMITNRHNDKDSVALIRGIEKPMLFNHRTEIISNFCSMSLNVIVNFKKGLLEPAFTMENFFWSREVPLIPVKQAQMLKEKMELDKVYCMRFMEIRKKINLAIIEKKNWLGLTYILERMYSNVIYPEWNPYTFIATKPSMVLPENKLVKHLTGDNYVDKLNKEMQEVQLKKYEKLENQKQLFGAIFSKFYSLGKLQPQWR